MTPRANHLPESIVDYQCVSLTNVAGETILSPPATPAKGNTLIFDALAISTVEGELLEGLSRQCEAVRVGIEGDSCFVKFTERVNMPHSGLRGRWARSVKTVQFVHTERIFSAN